MSFSESSSSSKRKGTKRGQKSLNHLLNFSYERTEYNYDNHHHNRHRYRKPIPKTQDQFVLANFQFVVRPPSQQTNANSGHYLVAKSDPDKLVEWSTIELIRTITKDEVTCPVCLENPVAPKITKCGHTFCYHCILRYLSTSDHNQRKCPMCNDMIELDALKSLQILPATDGELRLLRRPKNSIIPSFVDEEDIFPRYDAPIARFSRYTIIDDIEPIINLELDQIDVALGSSDMAEAVYLELARDQVKTRLVLWKRWASTHLAGTKGNVQKVKLHGHSQEPVHDIFGHDDHDDEDDDAHHHYDDHDPVEEEQAQHKRSKSAALQQKVQNLPYFYFYQSSDGRSTYLYPVNLKMLIQQHDAEMQNLPLTLNCSTFLQDEEIELTHDKRKMYATLRHLPLGADIRFLELDLSSLVSRHVMSDFYKILQTRADRRSRLLQKKRRELEEDQKREEEVLRIREYEREQRMIALSAESFPELSMDEVAEQISIMSNFELSQLQEKAKSKPINNKSNQSWGVKNITKTEVEKMFGTSPQGPPMELQGAWAQRSKTIDQPKPLQKKKTNSNNNFPAPGKNIGGKKKGKTLILSSGLPF
ncbi:hypothetical protein AKO1_014721 [Acrasis kona]|uniref:RING-type domain-containing protein n=1 Tax=Acrasis kona TaxID=1008807 RepID=A0AAW2Z1P0_9EUKA